MTDHEVEIINRFKDILSLRDDEVDEDLGIALTSLIMTAVHDKEPRIDITSIVNAIVQTECASSLEPLIIIPIVVSTMDNSVDDLWDVLARECSAKEVVMAVEEAVERLNHQLKAEGVEEDSADDELGQLSSIRQVIRFVRAYSAAIPRLAKWKKCPAETLDLRLTELGTLIPAVVGHATADDGRALIAAVSQLASTLAGEADEGAKDIIRHLVEKTVVTFANTIDAALARKAFAKHFSRLVVPPLKSPTSQELEEDVLTSTWEALLSLGITPHSCESRPSLASLVLLAHNPSYTFTVSTLAKFFPVVLSSMQSDLALDEVLSILLSSLAPLRLNTPRPELSIDLIIPLSHLLPFLASNHSDPEVRHYSFRIISLILELSPPALRFRILEELLGDQDLPPQIRVAAVGLLKEAVLQGLSNEDENIFASPHLFAVFGPIVLRPDPPNLFDSVLLDDFLESAEPLRLVECLAFFYVVMMRDVHNRTGIRDANIMNNVESALLLPLRTRMAGWRGDLELDADKEHDHNDALQLEILDMWLDRAQSAITHASR